jgi:Uma2 family endonuclease
MDECQNRNSIAAFFFGGLLMLTVDRSQVMSLEEFLANPRDRTEWIDGHIQEKQKDMTAKTGRIQARLATFWNIYNTSQNLGGEIYVETACRTVGRVRCPDVAYLTPELVAEHGDFKVLPQSFPLVAEIISPTDEAEELFTKVREYLQSGCLEVWLLFPDSQWVLVITAAQQKLCSLEQTASTQQVLPGFNVAVSELLA